MIVNNISILTDDALVNLLLCGNQNYKFEGFNKMYIKYRKVSRAINLVFLFCIAVFYFWTIHMLMVSFFVKNLIP